MTKPHNLIVVETDQPEHSEALASTIVKMAGVVAATPAYSDGFGRIVQIPNQRKEANR